MKTFAVSLLILGIILMLKVNAQDNSTRFEQQHHKSYIESHLKQTGQMLFSSLESNNVGIVSSSVQTIRELEQIFPTYKFDSLLDPLITLIENENSDTQVRILSALALDELHSEKGDKVIYTVAKQTNNQSVKDICIALSIESLKSDLASKAIQ